MNRKMLFGLAMLGSLCFTTISSANEMLLSKDTSLTQKTWIELAQNYPISYLSNGVAEAPSQEILASWWTVFNDDTLVALINIAYKNNRDLESARTRVVEARASLGISKSALLPWLDSNNSWTKAETPENSTGTGDAIDIYRLGLDASWEIDLFGGNRQKVKAGVADLEAQNAVLHSTWVSLASELALNYLSLRTLQEQLTIAEKNLSLQNETLSLLESRFRAGLTDALALNQARYTVEQTRSSIPPLKAGIERAMNALAILTGSIPGSLGETLIQKTPIPRAEGLQLVGIPANFLRQRPDIRVAEKQLTAQLARRKSAQTDFYPKLTLFGSIGLESLSTGNLFSSGSNSYSFGPKISWPIFHGGAIRNNIRVQTAREERALVEYEQVVLSAVAEVRDVLAAHNQEKARHESLLQGVRSAQEALAIANNKYRNGLTDFNNVIGAQRALLSFEEQLAISEGQLTSNVIRLFKSLGGGWAPFAGAETKK